MVVAGGCDASVEDILASMFTEIVQTLSADVVKILLPMLMERFCRKESAEEMNEVLEEFRTRPCLGDSLTDSFAAALHVPAEKCESTEKLTDLVENEVQQKVSSVLSVVSNSESWPEDPAVYIPGATSCISSLRCMLTHAMEFLKRTVTRAKCFRWRSNVEILSSRNMESEKATEDAERYAGGFDRGSPSFCDKFFASRMEDCFLACQFEKMKIGLKDMFRKKDNTHVVSLSSYSCMSSSSVDIPDDEHILPGVVPESRPQKKVTFHPDVTTYIIKEQDSSSLEYEDIKNDVDNLFQMAPPSSLQESQISLEIKKFSRELTDKMYAHLMSTEYCKLSLAPLRKCLSDTIISQSQMCRNGSLRETSPELLYVLTEDAVTQFLQKTALWYEKDPSVGAPTSIGCSPTALQNNHTDCLQSSSQTPRPILKSVLPSRAKRQVKNLLVSLLLELQLRATWRDEVPITFSDLGSIRDRLYNRARHDSSFLQVKDIKNRKKFLKGVLKELIKEIGPVEQTLRVAVSNPTAFDDAVLRCLKTKMEKTQTKSRVAWFFQVLGRPFRQFFGTNNDDSIREY
ncbi:uncharacterized protein LOC117829667 isoform X2 [Xyrichtys novacula]|uniref:Uncharacterized protein LOC117829667 isoform X2 n=1 Tax=Xyrichtys novacula TaxID=13765 RepID=A0AAV1FJ39_XYRNO|nr:uncharacterized protein LOC117829667 isoform X2 [Xyrichtys novacula]